MAARRCITTTTGVPWVMPSPNIPTLDSAIVYPGTVLFEGTNVSEGRGTTRPFELVGAPWVVAERFAGRVESRAGFRRPLPAGAVRADFSQARQATLRRLPDSRHRPARIPARARLAWRSSRHFAQRRPGVRLAPAAVRVRAREAADRHPRGIVGRCGSRSRQVWRRRRSRDRGSPRCVSSRGCVRTF